MLLSWIVPLMVLIVVEVVMGLVTKRRQAQQMLANPAEASEIPQEILDLVAGVWGNVEIQETFLVVVLAKYLLAVGLSVGGLSM